MTDVERLSARLDALEMQFAHQDRLIEDLNNTIAEQWRTIDVLTRRLGSLVERVQEASDNAGVSGVPEPPPPHY